MTTNRNTIGSSRLRTFLRYAWGDQVAAHRARIRVQPYDDYLHNQRGR
jgi:hypothetical protein